MPFTPFHLGPGLFAGAILRKWADLPTILLASVILDLEPFAGLLSGIFLGRRYFYHGFLHTFAGATLLAIVLAFLLVWLSQKYRNSIRLGGYARNSTRSSIFIASLVGLNLHIFVDSFVNTDMQPFWPYTQNPLLGTIAPITLYVLCIALFLAGALLLYLQRSCSPFLKSAVPK